MDNTFLFALFENLEKLIALSAITQVINLLSEKNPKLESILRSLLFVSVGIFIMMFPYTLEPGITFDSRSILLSLTALFYSLPTTLILTFSLLIFRIIMGGAGVYMGVMVIITSSLLGFIWKKHPLLLKYQGKWIYYYSLGMVVHLMMCLYMYLLPVGLIGVTLTKVGIPILISYPFVTIIIGKLFNLQFIKREQQKQIIKGEKTIRRIYDNAPIGILNISFKANILNANHEFCSLVGYSEKEIIDHKFLDYIISENKAEDFLIFDQLVSGSIESYSGDRLLKRRDETTIWISLSVSRIDDADGFIITVQDITRRKESEILIDYLAYHDQLTGAYNLKFLEERNNEWEQTLLFPKYLVCIDVDNLRIINDAFGFKSGDELLKCVHQAVYKCTKDLGKLIRFKSSEFLLYIFDFDGLNMMEIISNIRHSVEDVIIENIDVSVSIGIAEINAETNKISDLIYVAEENMRKEKLLSMDRSVNNTIEIIMKSLFAKNSREMHHSQRVSSISQDIAMKMRLDKYSIEKVRIAGLMHDIGKIGISEAILDKPQGLTEDERLKIQEHSIIGYRILSATNEFAEISDIILSHHERWDGKGYPRGLANGNIPLFARIIAIADTYDAMTSDRPYRNPFSSLEAIIEIKSKAGTQFDPEIVAIFASTMDSLNPALNVSEK